MHPCLRFKAFNAEWSIKKIGEIIDFLPGFAFDSKGMIDKEGEFQIIKMSNVYQGKLDLYRSPSFWNNLNEKNKKFILEKNDIILTLTGTIGKKDYGYSVLIPTSNKFLLNQRLVRLRGLKLLSHPQFIIQLIKTDVFLNKFFNISKGGTGNQSNVGIEELKSLRIKFPLLEEQQKIASFLSLVDEKIIKLKEKKELLEQYKKGVMQQIFSQKIRFKDENGEDFPDWEEVSLNEIASKVNIKNKNLEVNRVLSNSATQGIVNQQDYFDKDIANQKNLGGYYLVNKDDFVYNPRISSTAPVGPIKRNNIGLGVMSPLYTVFKFIKGNPDFFEYYFETSMWHDHMFSVANTGARHDRMNITNNDFFSLPISSPSLREQNKISSFLRVLNIKYQSVSEQITLLETWKKGLLQQMFV